jgi:two-component system sensor histidine kinase/response regulator
LCSDAGDGPAGIDIANQRKPELIVLDIMLPRMSGVEVLKSIRSNPDTEDIPVLMCSASSAMNSLSKEKKFGATDYFAKPIEVTPF